MSPLLKTNESVSIIRVDNENIRQGDVLVYRLDDNLIVHRLVRQFKNGNEF